MSCSHKDQNARNKFVGVLDSKYVSVNVPQCVVHQHEADRHTGLIVCTLFIIVGRNIIKFRCFLVVTIEALEYHEVVSRHDNKEEIKFFFTLYAL